MNISELSDGGFIEEPDSNGTIRRRDKDGNCEEARYIGDDGWDEWADLFDVTEANFTPAEVSIVDAICQLIQRHGPEFGLTKATYDGDRNSSSVAFHFGDTSYLISSADVEECS